VFWADYRSGRSKLKGQVRAVLAHPDTIDMIVSNDVNKVRVIAQDNVTGTIHDPEVRRLDGAAVERCARQGDARRLRRGGRDLRRQPTRADAQAPLPQAGADHHDRHPIPQGFSGRAWARRRTRTTSSRSATRTSARRSKGNGLPGRWADLRVPDNAPWRLEGRGVTNGLPVIEVPEKLVVLNTA
jgi:hypothetical protein